MLHFHESKGKMYKKNMLFYTLNNMTRFFSWDSPRCIMGWMLQDSGSFTSSVKAVSWDCVTLRMGFTDQVWMQPKTRGFISCPQTQPINNLQYVLQLYMKTQMYSTYHNQKGFLFALGILLYFFSSFSHQHSITRRTKERHRLDLWIGVNNSVGYIVNGLWPH